jgi:hypothetical protein
MNAERAFSGTTLPPFAMAPNARAEKLFASESSSKFLKMEIKMVRLLWVIADHSLPYPLKHGQRATWIRAVLKWKLVWIVFL